MSEFGFQRISEDENLNFGQNLTFKNVNFWISANFIDEKLNFYPKVIPNQRAAVFPAKKHYYDVECRVPPMQSPGLSLQTDPPGED